MYLGFFYSWAKLPSSYLRKFFVVDVDVEARISFFQCVKIALGNRKLNFVISFSSFYFLSCNFFSWVVESSNEWWTSRHVFWLGGNFLLKSKIYSEFKTILEHHQLVNYTQLLVFIDKGNKWNIKMYTETYSIKEAITRSKSNTYVQLLWTWFSSANLNSLTKW